VILTLKEAAKFVKLSPGQLYEQTRVRTRARQEHPVPHFRIGKHLRFRQSDLEAWVDRLASSAHSAEHHL
jgi:predicted DNA-binding transcriptional regulator AlpA